MVKVKFQCKRSGNYVSFTNENDIAGLRKHEGYIEVKDIQDEIKEISSKVEVTKKSNEEKVLTVIVKKLGRPKK